MLRAQARQYQARASCNGRGHHPKNALEASPADAEARYLLATVYLEQGDGVSAEKEIRLALQHGYAPAAALPLLGESLQLQGKFQKVLDETQAAAVGNDADLLCVRGAAFLALGKIDTAKQLYRQRAAGRPKHAPALIGLGRAAVLEHDFDSAGPMPHWRALPSRAAPMR